MVIIDKEIEILSFIQTYLMHLSFRLDIFNSIVCKQKNQMGQFIINQTANGSTEF